MSQCETGVSNVITLFTYECNNKYGYDPNPMALLKKCPMERGEAAVVAVGLRKYILIFQAIKCSEFWQPVLLCASKELR